VVEADYTAKRSKQSGGHKSVKIAGGYVRRPTRELSQEQALNIHNLLGMRNKLPFFIPSNIVGE
jgi:hypothetical protein